MSLLDPGKKKKPSGFLSSEIDPVSSSLNFAIGGKGNSLERSAPIVGTRKSQGAEQPSVSASHLSHLIVLSVLTVVALGL